MTTKLTAADNLHYQLYDDHVVLFDENNGQTHCLDSNIITVLACFKHQNIIHLDDLISQLTTTEDKANLIDYINNMVNSLVKPQLLKFVE